MSSDRSAQVALGASGVEVTRVGHGCASIGGRDSASTETRLILVADLTYPIILGCDRRVWGVFQEPDDFGVGRLGVGAQP